MGHAQAVGHTHPWRELVHEIKTGEYESSAAWDLVDAVCMGTLLLMIAGSILSVVVILLVDIV